MKKILKYILLLVMSLSLVTSCDDGFEEMNKNPLKSNDGNINYLFTYSLLSGSGQRYENWRTQLIYSSTMVQHLAHTAGYWSGDKYYFNAGYSASYFDAYFDRYIRELFDVIEITKDKDEFKNHNAMARIWKVVITQRLTDMYGDVPYSEAGKGYTEQLFYPKYDSQKDIYTGAGGMLEELKSCIAQLNESDPKSFGSADIIYGGDVKKWKKLANSLMLRLGLRLVKVDAAAAKKWAEEAITGGVMESNSDMCYIQHIKLEGINKNGNGESFSAEYGSNPASGPRISKTFIDFMKDHNDPRLPIIAMLHGGDNTPANQNGLPNGNTSKEIPDISGYSRVNSMLTDEDDPMFFQSYAEVEFMLAECALRGWGGVTDASAHYRKGVTAAMKQLEKYDSGATISDAAITLYLDANPLKAGNADAFEQICTQYWAACFLNEYEAWYNWRRTELPVLTPTNYDGNKTDGTIPRRMCYPTSEASSNKANYDEAVNKLPNKNNGTQGGMKDRVWWDVAATNNPG